MKLLSAIMTLASVYFLACPVVMAADTSTVNITGNVIASPCSPTQNLPVQLLPLQC